MLSTSTMRAAKPEPSRAPEDGLRRFDKWKINRRVPGDGHRYCHRPVTAGTRARLPTERRLPS